MLLGALVVANSANISSTFSGDLNLGIPTKGLRTHSMEPFTWPISSPTASSQPDPELRLSLFLTFRLHDVEGFGDLRWEDQKKLEKYITDSGGSVEEEEEEEEEEIDEEDKDFSMEYAKSSRSTCKECEEKIQKDEVRFSIPSLWIET